jgi:hypothetical protein
MRRIESCWSRTLSTIWETVSNGRLGSGASGRWLAGREHAAAKRDEQNADRAVKRRLAAEQYLANGRAFILALPGA